MRSTRLAPANRTRSPWLNRIDGVVVGFIVDLLARAIVRYAPAAKLPRYGKEQSACAGISKSRVL
jgi:hypothetical protein